MKTEIEKRASKFIDETDITYSSIVEIMVMFAEKELEAMNYTRSREMFYCKEEYYSKKQCTNQCDYCKEIEQGNFR